ncbi:MAG: 4Fe-4S binding protein [Candidatus Micrarchaeia archaeon]
MGMKEIGVYVLPTNDISKIKEEYPVSKADFGAGGKTNEWRLERPVVNNDKCIKCLICWTACPEATIIRHADNSVEVNYDYCKGCGICANECPVKAIDMKKEE